MQAAVFSDVDGTLVNGSLPRMVLSIGRELGMYSQLQVAELVALTMGAKLLNGAAQRYAQRRVYARSAGGYHEADVERLIEQLVPAALQRLKAPVIGQLRQHQQAGRPLVLLSAGFHEAIAQFGIALGGRGEGTRMQRENGRYLSVLDGPVCQGHGKAARAQAIIAEMGFDPTASYAYGDTASDIPFLELFGHPCAVDPDAKLAAVARERGWPILLTDTPIAA
jgi:HAD superfamily hydrolase (TIGR01490 family)